MGLSRLTLRRLVIAIPTPFGPLVITRILGNALRVSEWSDRGNAEKSHYPPLPFVIDV